LEVILFSKIDHLKLQSIMINITYYVKPQGLVYTKKLHNQCITRTTLAEFVQRDKRIIHGNKVPCKHL